LQPGLLLRRQRRAQNTSTILRHGIENLLGLRLANQNEKGRIVGLQGFREGAYEVVVYTIVVEMSRQGSRPGSKYGTAPGGDYESLPFISSSLGSEQGLIASDVPDTSGAEDPWTQVFRSGEEDLPSASLQTGHPKVPAFFLISGLRTNSLSLEFQRSGGASATIALIRQGEARHATSQAGTPTTRPLSRFNQFQGSVKRDGTPLGNVSAARLTYTNNLEPIEVIRDDGKFEGVDPTVAALSSTIDVRFADTALLAAAERTPPSSWSSGNHSSGAMQTVDTSAPLGASQPASFDSPLEC
jgi:Phage tail tube protein